MRLRLRLGPLIAVWVALLFALGAPAYAEEAAPDGVPDVPSAGVGQGSAVPGDEIVVSGDGWTPGVLVRMSICGQMGLSGSASCDPSTATVTPTSAEGTFASPLVVANPPMPCPCVIHVTTVGDGPLEKVDVPFNVEGMEYSEVTLDTVAAPVRIDAVEIGGGESLATLFGAAVTRTLTLTLTNPGTTTLVELPVRAGWGEGSDEYESGKVVGTVDQIDPGDTVTIDVPVELPVGAFGEYEVQGFVAQTGPFTTTTTHYPWGLMLLILVALALLGLATWRWFRQRRKRRVAREGELRLPEVSYIPELGGYLVRTDASSARRLHKQVGGTIEFGGPGAAGLAAAGAVGGALGTGAATGLLEADGAADEDEADAVIDLDRLDALLSPASDAGIDGLLGRGTDGGLVDTEEGRP